MFIYYKNWYNSVIRTLLSVYDFKDDFVALARKVFPPITTAEAKVTIRLLQELELIATDNDGFFRPTQKSISAPTGIKDKLIRQYQMSCIEQARNAAATTDDKGRIIATNTVSISELGYQRLISKIEKFRSEVRALVHKDEDPADRVYQITISFIPVTR